MLNKLIIRVHTQTLAEAEEYDEMVSKPLLSHASGQSGGTGGQPPDYKSAQKRIYFVSN
jgi:hypothetical protein